MPPIKRKRLVEDSPFWDGDPFGARGSSLDLSAAALAAACHHPDEGVRAACRDLVEAALGRDRLSALVESVSKAVDPHNADPLEPMSIGDAECFLIAALQCLASARSGERHVLRVTCADGPDLTGGVEFMGVRTCRRVDRRTRDGEWNLARGSVFHPASLREWASSPIPPSACRVASESDRRHAAIRIPGGSSGTGAYRAAVAESASLTLPAAAEGWWFGLRALSGDAKADEAIKSCAQRHARMDGGGPSLSAIGGTVDMLVDGIVIRFKTAESIMRLAALASEPGALRLPGIRPMGWLIFGQGEDGIDFVPSAHLSPPTWVSSPGIGAIVVPPDVVVELSRWRGPYAGHATLESLESFR